MVEKKINNVKNQLFYEALDNAALSMKMIIGSDINISRVDFSFQKEGEKTMCTEKKGANVHVLQTDVVGNYSATCFLLLDTVDVKTIHDKCLPKSILEKDDVKSRALKGGILLEIDNMISAAMVTIFANNLNTTIYGDVPKLTVLREIDANDHINKIVLKKDFKNGFRALLQVTELDITLDFVWFFEEPFFDNLIVNKQAAMK